MAVPDTNTFSLQDVETEIPGTQGNLSALFAASNDSGFNLTYKGAKDRLSNFRNYVHGGTGYVSTSPIALYPTTEGYEVADPASTITVFSDIGWNVTSNDVWAIPSLSSGFGNATFTVRVEQSETGRNTEIHVIGGSFDNKTYIVQAGG